MGMLNLDAPPLCSWNWTIFCVTFQMMDPAIFGIYLLQFFKETMKMDITHSSQLDPLCLTFMLITAHFLPPPSASRLAFQTSSHLQSLANIPGIALSHMKHCYCKYDLSYYSVGTNARISAELNSHLPFTHAQTHWGVDINPMFKRVLTSACTQVGLHHHQPLRPEGLRPI